MAKTNHTVPPPPAAPGTENKGVKSVKTFFEGDAIKKRFEQVMGQRAPAFIMSVLQLVNNDKLLAEADITSVYNAAAKAAVLNLPLDTNLQYVHIIGYKDNKKGGQVFAQLQLGWKGVIQLAQRTEKYEKIHVTDVRAGELVKEDLLTGDCEFKFEPDPIKRDTLDIIGYVSYFKLLSGFNKMVFWRIEKLRAHAKKYSKTYDRSDGKWNTDEDAMCKKTMIKEALSKWGVLSIELADAIKFDQAAVTDDGKPHYIDNPLTPYEDANEIPDAEADAIAETARKANQAEQDLFNKVAGSGGAT